MSAPLAAPLLLALFTATSAPTLAPSEEGDTPGTRHLELTEENAREPHPLRVSPRHSTHLVFDAPLQPGGVEVQERWVKKAVNEAEGMVTLRPSGVPPPDEPLTVTVRFADGQAPGSATFRLVVHPTRGEHEVQVIRQPSTSVPVHPEARRQRERAERYEAALARERTRPEEPRPAGLSGVVEAGLVREGKSIVGRQLALGKDFTQLPGEVLMAREAYSYRAEQPSRVALELHVENTETQPWTAEGVTGAELVSAEGVRLKVVRVWQPEPLVSEAQRLLVVEAEATVKQSRGTFLLKLGEAGGARTLTVRDLTFP
ncbi:DUF2381 family protein [Archangium gephyra]|uniref:DUF2381 family protein n=1 Tax=Archangium gephyra TaxID=48 RepID=UPI0035D4C707